MNPNKYAATQTANHQGAIGGSAPLANANLNEEAAQAFEKLRRLDSELAELYAKSRFERRKVRRG